MPTLQRHFHREFLLSCTASPTPDGRFQSRVAITYLGSERTVSQRFLDLDVFETEQLACESARSCGMKWIESNIRT
jgi:hypothetical protein